MGTRRPRPPSFHACVLSEGTLCSPCRVWGGGGGAQQQLGGGPRGQYCPPAPTEPRPTAPAKPSGTTWGSASTPTGGDGRGALMQSPAGMKRDTRGGRAVCLGCSLPAASRRLPEGAGSWDKGIHEHWA